MPKIAKPITSLDQELKSRIEWLENGLKQISNKTLGLDDMIQSILDGEPTTADEYNAKAKLELEKVNKGLGVLTSGMDALSKDKKYVRISDINKEIAKEWNRDREERINRENK